MKIETNDLLALLDSGLQGRPRIESFDNAMPLPNDGLTITLDDRGDVNLYKGNLEVFFRNFRERCSCLSNVLEMDFVEFLEPLVQLLNGDADEISTFHQSIYPIKTQFGVKKIGRFTLAQLDQKTFDAYLAAHQLPSHRVNAENFPAGYRLLLISEERAKRLSVHTHHEFFDRLDEIYTNHGLIVQLLQYFSGANYSSPGCWSTDNFPYASSSGASKLRQIEIGHVNAAGWADIEAILASLDPAVFFRLLIRSEFHAEANFQRLIFLRSLIDPILKKNERLISKKANQGSQDKTEVQAEFLLRIIANNASTSPNGLSVMEVVEFLKIRNAVIHPAPITDLKRLHLLFDKLISFRSLVYSVVFGTLVENHARQEDLFTVAVKP